ncbi:NAD(P)H-dependent oxidoreductase [Loktanella sp. S4079]|uniref:NAD(P)H-dependent oxidoreductase n=1 Tax=Loktanella sp. S4079 TaxID=579483 RepID=UPI0005F9EA89|nr:NAD(P)H-dependent oxidoreductase [Loktanella sp. S4079]KJZ19613.1 nitroreductase [Loktanella sp. S4079]
MLQERLNWRYATKKMDPSKSVPEEKVEAILEAIRLAPTSSGLQPFEVIVVTDPEVRAKLKDAAFDQEQLVDGSHLLVFAAWDNYTEARIDGVVTETGKARGGVTEALTGYYDRLKGMYLPRPEEVNFEHAARQAYIGLGLALTAAAFEEVDSTPMEGFEPEKFDEILGLRERGLRSVAIMPLGYRDAEGDWLNGQAKVRRDADKFITRIDAA